MDGTSVHDGFGEPAATLTDVHKSLWNVKSDFPWDFRGLPEEGEKPYGSILISIGEMSLMEFPVFFYPQRLLQPPEKRFLRVREPSELYGISCDSSKRRGEFTNIMDIPSAFHLHKVTLGSNPFF